MPAPPALRISDLHVTYQPVVSPVFALRGISIDLAPSAIVGVVGESGSGKSTLALSALMLLPPGAAVRGSVSTGGVELVGAPDRTLRDVRGRRVGLVVQGAGAGLNPVRTVGSQVMEALELRMGVARDAARARADALANRVGLGAGLLERYPHQLSGGERQRAMIAAALACEPAVLVLDEPTAGLDAEGRADLLQLLAGLRDERGTSMLLVAHDLAAVAQVADGVVVLYSGMGMERGGARDVLAAPRHPYTRDLLGAYPTMTTQKDLRAIRGGAPDSAAPPAGCPYHPRCTQALAECASWEPAPVDADGRNVTCLRGGIVTVLHAEGVARAYAVPGGRVEAVSGVSLSLRAGEVVGIVGETGSGKSTLARLLLGLEPPDAGSVTWEGRDMSTFAAAEWSSLRRDAAIVFQDPYAATSPRFTVAQTVREPLEVHRAGPSAGRDARVAQVLADVGLPSTMPFLRRPAHDLSGGELQRLAVARALVLRPRVLVADEATSMLDASEQARLLTLLKDMQVDRGMAMIVISHDLALVRKVADRIAVLHRGRIVEEGPAHLVVAAPRDAFTRRLVDASPRLAAPEPAPSAAAD